MQQQQEKVQYKVSNWSEYNKALISRGRLSIFIEDDLAQKWNAPKSGTPGRPRTYGDPVIEMCLLFKCMLKQPYRATEGFVKSLFQMTGQNLKVPCYTQISRRAITLPEPFKTFGAQKGTVDIVIDSTGLKVYGEGEWKVRQHGYSKRRTWKKIHLAMDPLSGQVVGMSVTANTVCDHSVLEEVLAQVENPIDRCFADGAYDKKDCYEVAAKLEMELVTPPAINAVEQANPEDCPALAPRDAAVQRIEELTAKNGGNREKARKQWKEESDYHCRSVVETLMYRFKQICGDKLFSRRADLQIQEAKLKVTLLNKFTSLGMPVFNIVPQI